MENSIKAQAKTQIRKDRWLAKALLRGKLRAWDEFYRLYAGPLYRFSLARLQADPEAAADVAQEVIVLAIERIRTFDAAKGSLWSWLSGIAMNKIHEALRSTTRGAKLRAQMREVTASQGRAASEDDNTSDVKLVLSGLNPHHQEVLICKYLNGQSTKGIAKAMGISEKAVESRLTRGRKAFRREYGKLFSSKEVSNDG